MKISSRFKKASFILMFTLCLSFSMSLNAWAAISVKVPDGDKASVEKVFNKWSTNPADISVEFKATEKVPEKKKLFEYSGGNIVFNDDTFNAATDKSRKKALGNFIGAMQSSPISEQTQQNLYDTISASNDDVSIILIPMVMDSTKADLYTGLKFLAPVLPFIRVCLGVGAILVILALFISTVCDLAFLGLPMARGDEGKSKIPFVSHDAVETVKEVEGSAGDGKGKKQIYLVYLGKRGVTYIVLSICILYLALGELGGLIAWLLNLVSGVV